MFKNFSPLFFKIKSFPSLIISAGKSHVKEIFCIGFFILGVVSGYFLNTFVDIKSKDKNCKTPILSLKTNSNEIPQTDQDDLPSVTSDKLSNDFEKEKCEIKVDVSGAVISPGVYCLDKGSSVMDAVLKAGDINRPVYAFKFVSQKINFARELVPYEKIYIPFQDDVTCQKLNFSSQLISEFGNPVDKSSSADISKESTTPKVSDSEMKEIVDSKTCVSLNNASQQELMELKGIGESTAQKIILSRPYKTVEDLKSVKGIGDVTFNNLKPYICL